VDFYPTTHLHIFLCEVFYVEQAWKKYSSVYGGRNGSTAVAAAEKGTFSRSGNRNITLLRRESLSIRRLAAENHRYAIVLHYASKGELDRTENDPVLRATHAPYMRGGRT
jgi:hypothetical protein